MAKLTTAEFIEAIKELSVLELNDLVKEVVDGAPKVVKAAVSKDEAEELKTKLEAEGAKVTLK